jgi:hypothetical protein
VTNPYGRNLDSLDRSRYFFFQVVPQFFFRRGKLGIVRSRAHTMEFSFSFNGKVWDLYTLKCYS